MARKLRIQYEGAIYHVINRGNYRGDVFGTVGAAQAFESVLFEACELHGWQLYGHVVMRNHYHLAIGTPRANLVEGMHWLQSTFATRFNRLRQERGHLFQGRYQALLVEDPAALARVVDYIHLNPVRAGVVLAQQLPGFRWSSLKYFLQVSRPKELCAADWLRHHGWEDNLSAMRQYTDYLIDLAEDETAQKRLGLEKMSVGWAIGTLAWRRKVAKDHSHLALNPGLEARELKEFKQLQWQEVLGRELVKAGKMSADLPDTPRKEPWKLSIAMQLREAGASFGWIAGALHMGKEGSVRVYLHRVRCNL